MNREHLGLFDTPPSRREIQISLATAAFFFATLLVVFPFRNVALVPVVAFIPVVNSVMFTGGLIVAALLYSQAQTFRSRALTALASGFVFCAVMLVPHALTFPGAFSTNGIGAGLNTTAWLSIFWRSAFPLAFVVYALLKHERMGDQFTVDRHAPRVWLWALGAVALACAATVMAFTGYHPFPPIFVDARNVIRLNLIIANGTTVVVTLLGMALIIRSRPSILDVWLLVALSGWLAQSLLNMGLTARFTLGFYAFYLMMMSSSLIVMLALVAESNRLYARLAISNAKAQRDREAQSMSMSAVAAAIAHEVGQPLAAARLNATAGVNWLHHKPRRYDKAEHSMQATIDAIGRVFDVVKSIRATFASGSGPRNDFSLSKLAEETVSLLNAELAAHKVSVELDLDEALPPVLGNRTQIQRVLVNLLTNAIDSVSAAKRRRRRISVRTHVTDGENAVLQVEDNGIGIGPEAPSQIFEPFYTTKSAGMGLGLSLSRSIVEEHGGRLWVTGDQGQGATFHMQLPQVSTALLLTGSVSGGKPPGLPPMEERLSAA